MRKERKWWKVGLKVIENGKFYSLTIKRHTENGKTMNAHNLLPGFIDIGDKWMLVTLSWWQFWDVSDRISIFVTSFGCWCPTLMLKDRGCCWQKRPKPSPTSHNCRQHISSPTSVTNINIADFQNFDEKKKIECSIWAKWFKKIKLTLFSPLIRPLILVSKCLNTFIVANANVGRPTSKLTNWKFEFHLSIVF